MLKDSIVRPKVIRFGYDEIEVWPEWCVNHHNCLQCYLEGKIKCAPRFWISIPRRVERIKVLSLAGKTPVQIARETGFPLGTVYSARAWLKKKGLNIPQFPREFPRSLKHEIALYVEQHPGLKYGAVGQHFDVTCNYVAKLMVKHGYRKVELDRASTRSLNDEITSYVKENPRLSYKEVARRFDVSHTYVIQLMVKQGYRKSALDRAFILEETLEATRLLEEQPYKSLQQIAREVGLKYDTLWRRLKRVPELSLA